MTVANRWRLAMPLVFFSAICVAFSIIGGWFFWAGFSLLERVLTVLIAVVFAVGFALSVSIAADRRLTEVPWRRLGLIALILAAGFGAVLLRSA